MKNLTLFIVNRIGTLGAAAVGSLDPQQLNDLQTAFAMIGLVLLDVVSNRLRKVPQ